MKTCRKKRNLKKINKQNVKFMRKLTFLLACLLVVSIGLVNAQSKSISGKVISADDGQPIIGATVKVKGSTTGTITNANGGFKISVQDGRNLLISFLGMKTVEVAPVEGLVVKLSADSKVMDEVVVTALGIQRQKRELGYSTVNVKSEELTQAKAMNVATSLQGKVAGLNIASINSGVFDDVKINLRGIRSLTGNNNPMLLLDGVPVALSLLSSLNPNDIENVNVLKGTSGAAVYGPDARNGVIVVTTKKGDKAAKPEIAISNTTQFSSISLFPEFQTKFGSGGSGSYIPYENWSWGPAFDGSLVTLGETLPNGDKQTIKYAATNDRKKFFDTGVTMQNDMSYSAKGFYLSLQDARVKGIVPNDENRRTGIRLNASHTYKNFTASLNTNYSQSNYDVFDNTAMGDYYSGNNVGLNGGLMNLIFSTPAQVPLTSYKDFKNNEYAQYNNYYNRYGINPYIALDTWRRSGKDQNLVTSLDLKLEATKWLDLNYRAAMTYQGLTSQNNQKRLVVNSYGAPRGIDNVPQAVSVSSYIGNRLSSDFFFNAHKELGDFKTTFVGGTYVREISSRTTGVDASNLVIEDLFNVSARPGELGGSSTTSKNRMFSLYGNATVTYKGYASLELSGRNDKISVLDPSNNSFFYPGVSASLVLTDAVPSLRSDVMNFLKLRGSWNKTGNADISPYSLSSTFSQADGFPYNGLPGYSADNGAYDKYLKPEFIESSEFGFEASFLQNRVNFDATYYNQNNTNQIVNISVPRSTGYSTANINAASFRNYGFETQLKLTPLVQLGEAKLNLNINYSYNNNVVKSIYNNLNELAIAGYAMCSNMAVVGLPSFVFNATDYVRDDKGRIIVDAVTGMPSIANELKKVGNTLPKHTIGISPSFTWKGITCSALFEYKGGYYNFNMIGNEMAWTGVSAITGANNRERFVIPNSVYMDAATGKYVENTNVTVYDAQEFFTSDNYRGVATNFITSAASWRFRELSITYDLPKSLISKQNIVQSVTIGFVGRNLALWLPKSNVYSDPDYRGNNSFLTGNVAGIANATVNPPTRTLGGTIQVKF